MLTGLRDILMTSGGELTVQTVVNLMEKHTLLAFADEGLLSPAPAPRSPTPKPPTPTLPPPTADGRDGPTTPERDLQSPTNNLGRRLICPTS